jgi:hypothetical protein
LRKRETGPPDQVWRVKIKRGMPDNLGLEGENIHISEGGYAE